LEASRTHAEIDVIGDRVVLHDLNSTNGTFVDEQKITSVTLENHSEFRIGSTTFMLIITDVE
jgi:pSer/pThr/pTyr-binding forkhead associated (FHA) protein